MATMSKKDYAAKLEKVMEENESIKNNAQDISGCDVQELQEQLEASKVLNEEKDKEIKKLKFAIQVSNIPTNQVFRGDFHQYKSKIDEL